MQSTYGMRSEINNILRFKLSQRSHVFRRKRTSHVAPVVASSIVNSFYIHEAVFCSNSVENFFLFISNYFHKKKEYELEFYI